MENNYIIFNQSGRFGNAVFRYMAYIMLQKNNNIDNKFKYILDTEFSKLSISPYINDEVDRGIYVKNNKIINEDNYFSYINIDQTYQNYQII